MNGKNSSNSGNKHLCFITAILITGGGDKLLQSICPRFKKLGYFITIYAAYPVRGNSSIRSDFEHQGISVKMPPPYISKILLMGIGLIPFLPSFLLYPICFFSLKKSIVFYKKVYHWVEKNFVNPLFHGFLILRVIYDHHFQKYFIISGNQYAMYPVLYRLKTLLKIPVFYTEISSPKWRALFINQINTKKYLNCFNKVFVPSSIIGEELKQYEGLQNKYYKIPFFVDLPEYIYQIPKRSARSFGLIARLSPEKNPDMLIQILKLVKKGIPDAKLILIGTGPLKQQLISIAISLGVLEDIQFIDHFEHIEEVIQKIDIFTLVSDVEGMPLTIIEALYFGKPVIATAVGSIPDMIVDGYNGYIIDKNQIWGIADHIIELMENDSQYKMMSQNSRLLYRSEEHTSELQSLS
jgi:glycosyltransferase involved in cell wall biosynthesis